MQIKFFPARYTNKRTGLLSLSWNVSYSIALNIGYPAIEFAIEPSHRIGFDIFCFA